MDNYKLSLEVLELSENNRRELLYVVGRIVNELAFTKKGELSVDVEGSEEKTLFIKYLGLLNKIGLLRNYERVEDRNGDLEGFKIKPKEAEIKLLFSKLDEMVEKKIQLIPQSVSSNSAIAECRIDGQQIYIGFKGEELLPLGRKLRYQGPYYNFMHYLMTHTNQTLSKHDIQEIEGCSRINDMTELVRRCHFDKELKPVFFEGTSGSTVRFTPYKELTGEVLERYKNRLKAIRN